MDWRGKNPQFLAAYDARAEHARHRAQQVQRRAPQARRLQAQVVNPERAFVRAKRLERLQYLERIDPRGRARLAERDRQHYLRMVPRAPPMEERAVPKNSRRRSVQQPQQQPTRPLPPAAKKTKSAQQLVQALTSMRIDRLTQLAQRERRDYERMKRVLLADIRVKDFKPHAKTVRFREGQQDLQVSPTKKK